MKLITPFTIINYAFNDVREIHDFKYQLPKDKANEYRDEEYILYPMNSYC